MSKLDINSDLLGMDREMEDIEISEDETYLSNQEEEEDEEEEEEFSENGIDDSFVLQTKTKVEPVSLETRFKQQQVEAMREYFGGEVETFENYRAAVSTDVYKLYKGDYEDEEDEEDDDYQDDVSNSNDEYDSSGMISS